MASLYDIIMVKGNPRYRLNKNFIAKDKVPANVLAVLDEDNVVDETGNIIVDQKNDEAKQVPAEDEGNSLPRVDETETDDSPSEDADDSDDTTDTEETNTTPIVVDDSANQTQNEEVQDDGSTDGDQDTESPKQTSGAAPKVPEDEPADTKTSPKVEDEKPQEKAPEEPTRTADNPVEPRFRSKVPQSSPGMGFPRKNGKTVDIFDLVTPHTHVKYVGGHTVPLSRENFKSKSEGMIIDRLRELGFEILDFNEIERQQGRAGAADPLLSEDTEEDDIQLG